MTNGVDTVTIPEPPPAAPAPDREAGGAAADRPSLDGRVGRALAATRHFRPVLLLVVVLFAYFAITQSVFLTSQNLQNLLTGVSILWVVAMGMTFVILTGGVDLSVSALSVLTGIFLAKVLAAGVPGGVAVVLAMVLGAAIGAATNGLLIGKMKLSFFVVTLGSLTVFTGVVNLWANTKSFYITAPIVSRIGVQNTLGVPTPILLMVATFAVGLYIQTRTYFGRDVYAVGGSLQAARLSGIRTSRTIVCVYAITGACAALGGVIAAGRIGAATPQVDNTLALQAAAAVLLGGTSLFGGAGGVGGTALGVLFIGVLQNGLSIAGIQSFWQQVVTGVILIAAVMGDRISLSDLRRRRRGAGAAPADTALSTSST
jgi:ribose/xylose/arabinose/galactoside ABC-type transport system permease subunit